MVDMSIVSFGSFLFKWNRSLERWTNSKTIVIILVWFWLGIITPRRCYHSNGNACCLDSQKDILMSSFFPPLLIFSVSEFACHITGCCAVFNTLEEFEHHYNSLHRHMCCSCRRSFPTARLLDIHIQEWHDSLFTILAEKQDMVGRYGDRAARSIETV